MPGLVPKQDRSMHTYDKLIATIRAAKARGCLRACLGLVESDLFSSALSQVQH